MADGPGAGARRLRRRGQRDRGGDAADGVRHAAPGAGPGPDPAVHGPVRADLGAGDRDRRGPEPARPVRARGAVGRAEGGGGPAGACAGCSAGPTPTKAKRHPAWRAARRSAQPRAVLAGIVLAAIGFFCFGALHIQRAGRPGPGARPGRRDGAGLVRADDRAPRCRLAGHRVLHAGERDLAGRAGGGVRAAADPGDRVPVRPAGRGGGVRHADPGPARPVRVAVHRRPDQAAGMRGEPMLGVILALLIVPLAAGLACAVRPKASPVVTGTSGVASFGLVLALVPATAHHDLGYLTYLRVDALSVIFLLATGFLYAAVGIYSIGYIQHHGHGDRYARRFYAGFNLFAWAMLAAPLMSSLALLWIAVEVTTIISALLVAIEAVPTGGRRRRRGRLEVRADRQRRPGPGPARHRVRLLRRRPGPRRALQPGRRRRCIQHAAHLAPTPVRLAFLLALLGYGTKVGLFPVHTWLPDAHSEAPTPVSALLSGSLLAVSLYAILRYYQVAAAALGSGFPRDALLAFGVASLLLAALYVFGQRDIKRLLAYSSIEHMGIVTIGVSFGAPVALAGVMLHVLAHAAAKGNAFMGAGVFTVKYGTKQIATMRGALDVLPWSGPLFLLGDLRAVRAAALGHLPQRVPDRGGRPGLGQLRRRGGAGRAGHGGVLRADHRVDPDPVHSGPAIAVRGGGDRPRRAQRLDGGPGGGRRRGPVHPRPAPAGRAHRPDLQGRGRAGERRDDDDPTGRAGAVAGT